MIQCPGLQQTEFRNSKHLSTQEKSDICEHEKVTYANMKKGIKLCVRRISRDVDKEVQQGKTRTWAERKQQLQIT